MIVIATAIHTKSVNFVNQWSGPAIGGRKMSSTLGGHGTSAAIPRTMPLIPPMPRAA
jgi:hypothetical protein